VTFLRAPRQRNNGLPIVLHHGRMNTERCEGAILAVILFGLLASACSNERGGEPALPSGTLRIGSAGGQVVLHVRIAATDGTRRAGLMGVPLLAPDAGMAFLYARPHSGPYWMKDTVLPLSIAFWGHDRRIVAILDMSPCRADPCRLYDPGMAYMGAVEANRGFFRTHGVSVGDTVAIAR
jgi:uncharacterized membrane protein (UPF0127 family)